MELFSKLSEITLPIWCALGVLVTLGVLLLSTASKVKWNAQMLAIGALCIAVSFVLSYIRIFRMPQGGSVTLMSMLPVMLFSYLYGIGPGMLCTFSYGILQFIQQPEFYSLPQFALDYLAAFTVLGLAGLPTNTSWNEAIKLPFGVALGGLLRTLCSFLSGYLFFADYAPAGTHPAIYSLVYNFSITGTDTLICVVGAALLVGVGAIKPLKRLASVKRVRMNG